MTSDTAERHNKRHTPDSARAPCLLQALWCQQYTSSTTQRSLGSAQGPCYPFADISAAHEWAPKRGCVTLPTPSGQRHPRASSASGTVLRSCQ